MPAVIGLDGLDPRDIAKYDIPGEWHTHDIATVAHTAPSWNGIFTGEERPNLYDFFKTPENARGMLAQESDTRWQYRELRTDKYPWEQTDVNVVSAPVVLPAYSTVWGRTPTEYGWPTTPTEITESIDALAAETKRHESVITVFPQPDKLNHMVNKGEHDYTDADRREHMDHLMRTVQDLMDTFDKWLLVSDHGRPGAKEWPTDDLWVPSHYPKGVVRSNAVGVTNVDTNLDIHARIIDLLNGNATTD